MKEIFNHCTNFSIYFDQQKGLVICQLQLPDNFKYVKVNQEELNELLATISNELNFPKIEPYYFVKMFFKDIKPNTRPQNNLETFQLSWKNILDISISLQAKKIINWLTKNNYLSNEKKEIFSTQITEQAKKRKSEDEEFSEQFKKIKAEDFDINANCSVNVSMNNRDDSILIETAEAFLNLLKDFLQKDRNRNRSSKQTEFIKKQGAIFKDILVWLLNYYEPDKIKSWPQLENLISKQLFNNEMPPDFTYNFTSFINGISNSSFQSLRINHIAALLLFILKNFSIFNQALISDEETMFNNFFEEFANLITIRDKFTTVIINTEIALIISTNFHDELIGVCELLKQNLESKTKGKKKTEEIEEKHESNKEEQNVEEEEEEEEEDQTIQNYNSTNYSSIMNQLNKSLGPKFDYIDNTSQLSFIHAFKEFVTDLDPKSIIKERKGKDLGDTKETKQKVRIGPVDILNSPLNKGNIQMGGFAREDIPVDFNLGEYKGEILKRKKIRNPNYAINLDTQLVIDASYAGNMAQFYNQSSNYNIKYVKKDGKIFMMSAEKIKKNASLLAEYREDQDTISLISNEQPNDTQLDENLDQAPTVSIQDTENSYVFLDDTDSSESHENIFRNNKELYQEQILKVMDNSLANYLGIFMSDQLVITKVAAAVLANDLNLLMAYHEQFPDALNFPCFKIKNENGHFFLCESWEQERIHALPLAICLANPSNEIIKYLIENGCNVNMQQPFSGDTLLHIFSYRNDKNPNDQETTQKIISTLIEKGADVALRNRLNNTVIHQLLLNHQETLAINCIDLLGKKKLSEIKNALNNNDEDVFILAIHCKKFQFIAKFLECLQKCSLLKNFERYYAFEYRIDHYKKLVIQKKRLEIFVGLDTNDKIVLSALLSKYKLPFLQMACSEKGPKSLEEIETELASLESDSPNEDHQIMNQSTYSME